MLQESLLGGQVRDILSALQLLKKHGLRNVMIYADGEMCIPAGLAALLSPVSAEVRFNHAPKSWKEYLSDPSGKLSQGMLPYVILQYTDLPDLYRMIGMR